MDAGSQERLQDPPNSDIPGESEPSCLGKHETTSSNTQTDDSHKNPLFSSEHDKRQQCAGDEQTHTEQNVASKCDMEQQKMGTEKSDTSPQGVSDLEFDQSQVTDSGNTVNGNHFQNPESCSLSSEIQRETESRFLRVCVPFLTDADITRIKKELSRNEEKTQTSGNGLKECDMEHEEMETKNMWKLRANRVEQIISALNKQLRKFNWSRKLGLQFNVGFGPKQNMSVDSLKSAVLLEIAKFALAINSSQQDFIMEILDYNFDLGLPSEHHRSTFACEVMDRAKQLSSCEDAVKLSNDIFELPVPVSSIYVVNQNVSSVIPELGSISSMEKCDVSPVCLPDSCAKSEEHISQLTVDLYPWCKEIGLKLHVNSRQPHKKLKSNTFTNGAMTEVMNFAEKLCGTFEQICLDILRHNFDLDSQNGDSDLARNILAQIPVVIEQTNLSSYSKAYKKKLAKYVSLLEMLDCQSDPTFEECGSGSSSATMMDQSEGRVVDSEYQHELDAVSDDSSGATTMDQKMDTSGDSDQETELNLMLWKLRANQIQQVLSIPHEEHCPLYSYRRCKNLGIDFNVGSGVKRNLDPKLLTNGIMVELSTFAIALVSAKRYFITDILEYNFNLNLKNELCRTAFTQKTMEKVTQMCQANKKKGGPRLNMPFELPDTRSVQEPIYNKTRFCPKCYQARNQKLHQHESDTGPLLIPGPQPMTHTVSTDGNCTAQNPSKAPSTTEETMMDSYPRCKKIGLDLCVKKHQPRDKLCNNVLTRGIMMEVLSFTRKLSGTKNKVINDLLEHNFNIRKQSKQHNLAEQFYTSTLQKDGGLAWFDKVFVTHPVIPKATRYEGKVKRDSLMQGSEWKETIKKRKLALQTKEERNTLPSHNARVVESKKVRQNLAYCYPVCTEIGLDLDVTSKSGEKEKLDLNLLTTAVVVEINKFASNKIKHYFPGTVFDILDYNFDLSSQHHRRWEFTIAIASQVQALVRRYRNKSVKADKVFKLPFVFPPKSRRQKEKSKQCSQEEPNETRNEGSGVHQVEYHASVGSVNFLRGVETYDEPWSHDENTKASMDPWRLNMQENSGQVSVGCGSPLQKNIHIKDEENDPYYGDVKPEPYTEEEFSRHYDVKTESVAGEVRYLVPVEPQGTLENTGNQEHFKESTSSEILRKSESSCHVICVPFTTTTDISATLPTVHQADECGLYGGEDQTQIPWNDETESDMEQEKMGRWDDHICPLAEFGLNSEVIDSANTGNGNHLQSPTCSDPPRISEPSLLISYPSSLTSTELSSSSPAANFEMNPPLTSHPEDRKGLCGGEEQTQTTKNAQNICDMAQEEIETENMWRLRANRIEQILSASNKEFKTFFRSKRAGLEFNVGFGPKQNISGDSLTNAILLEIAKFALAINASQQDFIMEILEYNFDLGLQSKHHRNIFACEIMDRVRQLKTNKDAIKVSNEVFELPGLVSIHMGSVIPELGSIEKCDAAVCLPDSDAETSKHISCQSVGLYPWCKEIGLKLHVNSRQPHKKLEFNRLTNGAITEVTDFAEKLCGTFEQICLDILRHNFDLDLQNEDSDLARNILTQIPALIEQSQLLSCKKGYTTKKDGSLLETLDYQNQPDLDVCGSSSSSAPIIDQNEGSSLDNEKQNELDLKLWKLRANHIKQILSTPHEEHCPFYSYSRCKKLGIDFNVGSGEKQNLDSKLLTNGIVVELNNFATELQSARKHFVTEILDYNFNLNLKNEACRTDFAGQTMIKIKAKKLHKRSFKRSHSQFPFELPDMTCIQEPPKYCPRCYQYRQNTMTNTVSAHSNCTAQNLAKDSSFTFSTVEEKIMDNYPCCKKIGLNLFVDRDQPKDKLDTHVLTFKVMFEVANFAQKLCGTKYKMIYALIRHNFDIGKHCQDLDPTMVLTRWKAEKVVDLAWLNEVFVFNPYPIRQPGHVSKLKRESDIHPSEWKEAIKKRKLALQTKEGYRFPSTDGSSGKSKTNLRCTEGSYPICTVIGLDLDVTSKSRQKEKLDLKLLTRAVMMEIHTFATHQAGLHYPRTVFDILDYNFDLSSQYYRRWEFSMATASEVQSMVKQYCKTEQQEVFTLPFVFDSNASQKFGENTQNKKDISSDDLFSLPTVNSNDNSKLGSQPGHSRWISEDEAHIQASTNVPHETDMEQEEMKNYYTCPLEECDLDSDEVTGLKNTGKYPPYSCQLDKKVFYDNEEQTHAPRNVLNKYEVEENEIGTENNLWKLRSNQIEQILSGLNKHFGPFTFSKRIGLEFNVGFGPKQNMKVDSLKNSVLLEIAKFALAINSSQKDFIMEILEYNFDLGLQSKHHRNIFACELMKRVRQLRSCEDAVRFSDEVFELPGPMASVKVGNHSVGSAISPSFPSDSHAESKEEISPKSVDLYPWCKEIGLKLHVNSRQPHKNLEFSRLTNGAITEVTDFAEKLCGTFEQICLDILTHNFDVDLSGDSDLARNILARIPAMIEHRNLTTFVKFGRLIKGPRKDVLTMEKLDCQNNPDLDAFSDASSSAAIMDQKLDASGDSDQETELNLKLWKLRVNQIQQVLSTPHEEHCPLYSYWRCKKLGIDFDVGYGVKQNLDPTLLTNGIMVELNTFATALVSARKHFVTEILEYNFNLDLNNELSRTAFAQQTHNNCLLIHKHSSTLQQRNMPFELPDMTCVQNAAEKMTYCPKCYEARQLHKDGSNSGHMHKPAKDLSTSTFSTTEETIMDSSPCCKEIGLDLCVNKDQPKAKLDTNVLTRGIMAEVVNFSGNLCGTKNKIINDVLDHNFNIDKQGLNKSLAEIFCKDTSQDDEERTWFNDVFDFHSVFLRLPRYKDKTKQKCVRQGIDWKEPLKKQLLAPQAKEERDANLSHIPQSTEHCYPICTEIGLDLDVTSKSRKKEKLPLKLLTTAVVLEIHKFASKKVGHYQRTVFDILDCNFDLSSQHYRRWEFSIATASKFQIIAERYCEEPGRADEVFTLPFVFDPKASERCVQMRQNKKSRRTYPLETDLEQKEIRPENSYTCPLEESDLDEDDVRGSGNTDSDDHLPKPQSCSLSSKIPAESGTVNSKISPTIAGQPDILGLCRNEEKTMAAENAPKECELEQEDVETEMMWKFRSNRVEQILSALNEEFCPFRKSKKVGLEFNVGFGPKQNIGVDFLSNHVLLEIAEFALAINSSQKDFILEILENNFDLGLHSQSFEHRNDFAFEVMDRVRQLRSHRDAIKLSSEVFELPGVVLSVNMANQSASCISRMENAETVSQQSVGLYPWCKEIGLRLHANNPQPHKKLEINKLTNGAMTEVMNFAEKLCGTFEQICLDILRHNFDLDWQSGDSDLARNIVEQIPATIEQLNLSTCVKTYKIKGTRTYISTVEKLDCQSKPTSDACGADSSQAAITDQTEGSSADSEPKNELNLKLWKLRAHHIQKILSIPHEEHCPLYSYSRCKKLGIDFNVGSGVKQNLDPKLLTNGIMVEFNALSTALKSATKHFITEILEYNFNLNFKNELYRSAFAKQIMEKITIMKGTCRAGLKKLCFELPDMTCIRPLFEKTVYCPKCYQDRRNKLLADVSDPAHMKHASPHFRTNLLVAPDANFMVQKPAMDLSPTLSKAEEELIDSYSRCKEVGLSLFVNKDQPRDKLDTHVLTRGMILEVANFARRLSGIKNTIIPALVEHNFNISMPERDAELVRMFSKAKALNDGELAWFDKVFVIHPVSHREPGYVGKMTRESAMKGSERKETIRKRKLALQTKEETATPPSPNTSVLKAKRCQRGTVNLYPVCTEIGLDLDVTSKSGEKEKLDLQLLTRGVAVEIHKFVTQKRGCYYPGEVFDILDYNFDLSSQHDRRWEFSITTASIVQANYKQYLKKREKLDMVFKLPFVFPPKSSNSSVERKPKRYSKKESDKTQHDDSCVHQVQYHSDVNHIHFFGDVRTEEEHWYYEDATGTHIDPWKMNVQMNQSQANTQMKEENNPHYGYVKPELDTDKTYYSHNVEVKMESDTGDVLRLVPGEPAGSLGYTVTTMCPESQNKGLHYYVLTEPQGCEGHAMLAVSPSTGSHIKTVSVPAGVMYVVPVEAAASQGYTLMNTGQGQASTSIKEEHENMPVDSYQYEVVSNTEGEVGIEQK